ncbi:unnamed protein product [Caenorhabditis angaria]|uniref:Uncharacterized protein n=1 Tax=Caenorhabditis angaria TaxID=860376 RepID=A0A9P1ILE3_9PELO|nr:unnamed protein product [Caenorhabditis angaria]
MSAKFLIFSAFVFGLATCQTQQTINLDGSDQIKLKIVFQPEQQQSSSSCATGNCGQQQQTQVQASPCSTGNCGGQTQQVQQSSPCASGNCGQQTQQVQVSPCSTGNCGQQVQQASPCSTGNCGQQVQASPCSTGNCPSYDSTTTTTQAPITIPIQSSNVKVIRIPSYSSGCSSSGCNFFRPRCPGCARRRFFYPPPPPPRFFSPRFFSSSLSSSGSIGIPDTVFANGRAYNAPLRVPTSYQDGNPVFSSSG